MMRHRLACMVLLALAGSPTLAAAQAPTAWARESVTAVATSAHARSLTRSFGIGLSPAPDDLALAEISFHPKVSGQRLSGRDVRVVAQAPYGDDYAAVAASRSRDGGNLRLLVLVVNRPSPLEDPVQVRLRVTARRSLGKDVVWKLTDPFAVPSPSLTPALCNLPSIATEAGAGLLALAAQGSPLAGFGVSGAVAAAYDAACGLPTEASFQHDVTGSSSPAPEPPAPTPPAPAPPVCTPCDPAPGYACPEAQPSICAVPVAAAARRASAGAH
jgi:hypothetical protein